MRSEGPALSQYIFIEDFWIKAETFLSHLAYLTIFLTLGKKILKILVIEIID